MHVNAGVLLAFIDILILLICCHDRPWHIRRALFEILILKMAHNPIRGVNQQIREVLRTSL